MSSFQYKERRYRGLPVTPQSCFTPQGVERGRDHLSPPEVLLLQNPLPQRLLDPALWVWGGVMALKLNSKALTLQKRKAGRDVETSP